MGCIVYAENVVQTLLMKSIQTSPGCDSHRPHVSTIEQNWENVDRKTDSKECRAEHRPIMKQVACWKLVSSANV